MTETVLLDSLGKAPHKRKTPDKIEVFSTQDRGGIRTYIFDRDESYVVILETKKRWRQLLPYNCILFERGITVGR